jgi:putative acetyltransferase
MRIAEDDLSGREIAVLLQEHVASMLENSPPGLSFALDLDTLRQPNITFLAAWDDTAPEGLRLMGCGALKQLGGRIGEVKSMRTSSEHLRKGVAAAVLQRLIDLAMARNYESVKLETGTGPAFAAAQTLYERFGFVRCGPFGDYVESPFNVFYTLALTP